MKTCETCRFWDRAEGSDSGDEKMGLCRRNPAVIVDSGISRQWDENCWMKYSGEPVATWALTESEDWCGEWKGHREAIDEIKRLREALEEIRDIARVSEGTEFYAMLAERGLKETNK